MRSLGCKGFVCPGVVASFALHTKDMEYLGSGSSWVTMARPMLHQGLVEHQEPGVPVAGLKRIDARVKRQDLGRKHHPRQAELPPGRHDRQKEGDHRKDPARGPQPG
jgi:hypothetical protein